MKSKFFFVVLNHDNFLYINKQTIFRPKTYTEKFMFPKIPICCLYLMPNSS